MWTLTPSNQSGLGASNGPYQMDLRTYVWSDLGSLTEAQSINDQLIGLLSDAALTITGFTQCGLVRWEETLPPMIAELNGIQVHEVDSNFTLWVQQ